MATIRRVTEEDGALSLESAACRYRIRSLGPGVVLMSIRGRETGEVARAVLGEIAAEAALRPPLRLFIDMTGLTHVDEAVSDDWTAWFRAHREVVASVDVLAPEVFVRLVVAVSQVFSRTEGLIRIHRDAAAFEASMLPARATPA